MSRCRWLPRSNHPQIVYMLNRRQLEQSDLRLGAAGGGSRRDSPGIWDISWRNSPLPPLSEAYSVEILEISKEKESLPCMETFQTKNTAEGQGMVGQGGEVPAEV